MASIKIDFSLENKQEKIKLLKLSQFKNFDFLLFVFHIIWKSILTHWKTMWCTCLLIYQVQNGNFKSTYLENGESSYHIEIDIKPCVVSFLPLINYWLSLCYYCSPPVSFFQNYLAEEKTTTKTKKTVKSSQHSTSYHTCTENEF